MAGRGPKLQVKNTFLDYAEDPLQDDDLAQKRRPRAQTDISDLKAPRKVSYNIESSSGKASLETTAEEPMPRSRTATGVMTPNMRSPELGYMPMNLADLTADLAASAPTMPGGGLPGMLPPSAAGYPPMPAGFPGYGMPGLAGLPGLPGLPGAPPWGSLYPGVAVGCPMPTLPGMMGHRPPEFGAYEPSAASQPYAGAHAPQHGYRQPAERGRGRGRGGRGSAAGENGAAGRPQGQAGKKADAASPAAPGRTGRCRLRPSKRQRSY